MRTPTPAEIEDFDRRWHDAAPERLAALDPDHPTRIAADTRDLLKEISAKLNRH